LKHIKELLSSATKGWRRQMLAQLKQHIRAECRGNLDKLMKQKITLPNAGL